MLSEELIKVSARPGSERAEAVMQTVTKAHKNQCTVELNFNGDIYAVSRVFANEIITAVVEGRSAPLADL